MSHVAISGKKIHCVKKAKSVEKLSGGGGVHVSCSKLKLTKSRLKTNTIFIA